MKIIENVKFKRLFVHKAYLDNVRLDSISSFVNDFSKYCRKNLYETILEQHIIDEKGEYDLIEVNVLFYSISEDFKEIEDGFIEYKNKLKQNFNIISELEIKDIFAEHEEHPGIVEYQESFEFEKEVIEYIKKLSL